MSGELVLESLLRLGEVQPRISPLDRGIICGIRIVKPDFSSVDFRP